VSLAFIAASASRIALRSSVVTAVIVEEEVEKQNACDDEDRSEQQQSQQVEGRQVAASLTASFLLHDCKTIPSSTSHV